MRTLIGPPLQALLYGDPTEPGPSVITVLFLWILIINLNNGPKGQNIN